MNLLPLHFIRSEYFLLLLPLALLFVFIYRLPRYSSQWSAVIDQALLKYLLIDKNETKKSWPLLLLATSWLIAVIALAGPSWQKQEIPLYQNQQARVVLLDLSEQMQANDLKPNRLTRARYKALDIIKANQEGLLGMVVFTRRAFTVSPLTSDSQSIAQFIPLLSPEIMPVQGHDVSRGLQQAADLIQQASNAGGEIILLSSGPVNYSAIDTAEKLAQKNIHTSVLAVGTDQGSTIPSQHGLLENRDGSIAFSKLDSDNLKRLAAQGDGYYVAIQDDNSDVNAIINFINSQSKMNDKSQKKAASSLWHDDGRYFVFLLLPLLLLGFRQWN